MILRVTPARASASLPQFPTIPIGRSLDAFNRRPGTNAALEPKAGGPVMKDFGADSLDFLRRLARNNAKPWFEAHRGEYEQYVKQPMSDLVEEMDLRMARFAPEMVGHPKRSVFRIHRDVRFSPDKSPYKT